MLDFRHFRHPTAAEIRRFNAQSVYFKLLGKTNKDRLLGFWNVIDPYPGIIDPYPVTNGGWAIDSDRVHKDKPLVIFRLFYASRRMGDNEDFTWTGGAFIHPGTGKLHVAIGCKDRPVGWWFRSSPSFKEHIMRRSYVRLVPMRKELRELLKVCNVKV